MDIGLRYHLYNLQGCLGTYKNFGTAKTAAHDYHALGGDVVWVVDTRPHPGLPDVVFRLSFRCAPQTPAQQAEIERERERMAQVELERMYGGFCAVCGEYTAFDAGILAEVYNRRYDIRRYVHWDTCKTDDDVMA